MHFQRRPRPSSERCVLVGTNMACLLRPRGLLRRKTRMVPRVTSWQGVPLRSAPRHSAQCLPVCGHAVREQGGGHVLVPLGARKLVSFPKWEILELVRVVWLAFGILAEKAVCHSWFLNLVGTWKGKVGLAVDDQCS